MKANKGSNTLTDIVKNIYHDNIYSCLAVLKLSNPIAAILETTTAIGMESLISSKARGMNTLWGVTGFPYYLYLRDFWVDKIFKNKGTNLIYLFDGVFNGLSNFFMKMGVYSLAGENDLEKIFLAAGLSGIFSFFGGVAQFIIADFHRNKYDVNRKEDLSVPRQNKNIQRKKLNTKKSVSNLLLSLGLTGTVYLIPEPLRFDNELSMKIKEYFTKVF